MPPNSTFLAHFVQKWLDLLRFLSALTLGEIWTAIYNPPTPFSLSILAIALAAKAPEYYRQFGEWRLSKRVVEFAWPLPSVSWMRGVKLIVASTHWMERTGD